MESYGVLEGICGTREEDIYLDDGELVVSDVLPQLIGKHDGLEEHLKHMAFAVDNKLRPEDAALRDGSVLALLPPVSGG